MENLKPAKTEKKGFDWNGLFSFTSEIAKLAIAAGVSAYITESVRNSMSRRKNESNVLDFTARKAA